MKTAKLFALIFALLSAAAMAGEPNSWGKLSWDMKRADVLAIYPDAQGFENAPDKLNIDAGKVEGVPCTARLEFRGKDGGLSAVLLTFDAKTIDPTTVDAIIGLYRQKYGPPVSTKRDPITEIDWQGEANIKLLWSETGYSLPFQMSVFYENPKNSRTDNI